MGAPNDTRLNNGTEQWAGPRFRHTSQEAPESRTPAPNGLALSSTGAAPGSGGHDQLWQSAPGNLQTSTTTLPCLTQTGAGWWLTSGRARCKNGLPADDRGTCQPTVAGGTCQPTVAPVVAKASCARGRVSGGPDRLRGAPRERKALGELGVMIGALSRTLRAWLSPLADAVGGPPLDR